MSTLGVLLISGGHERAHYALVLATGAAAIGREVTLFCTNAGVRLLLAEQPLLADAREAQLATRGVAGIGPLLAAAQEMGIGLLACEAGLASEDLRDAPLLDRARSSGVVTFLAAVGAGQIVTL